MVKIMKIGCHLTVHQVRLVLVVFLLQLVEHQTEKREEVASACLTLIQMEA